MGYFFMVAYLIFFCLGCVEDKKEIYLPLFIGAIICYGIGLIILKLEKLEK